ncbi:MAG: tripartite tricarboxylate transporter substrate binding protein [Gemmatimonadetes bacterium]|nr:tripartite tricarboxylate transporter substrate binding protein [Gemmatimonadota bacterium]
MDGKAPTGRRAVHATALAVASVAWLACAPSPETRGWECLAPAAAGGGWDLTCRSVGQVLSELGLARGLVRTTNLPGAGGGVAFARAVAQRNEDPNVLIAASPSTTLRLAQGQYGDLTVDDVRWVGAIGAEYGILAVAADSPLRSLDDVLAAWLRDPSSLVVSGGSAVAGQDHMKMLLLADRAGIDPLRIRYVPFDGGGEAMTALLGGFVDLFSGEASEVEGQITAGRIRVLVTFAPERTEGVLAGVPTARESGVDLTWVTWRGFYVPRGIDDTRYRAWVDVLEQVGRSSEWERARASNRLQPFFMVGSEFDAFVQAQVEDFRRMSRELGLIE